MKGFNSWKRSVLIMLYVMLKLCKGALTPELMSISTISKIQEIIVDMGVDQNDEPVSDYLKNALAQTITDDSTVKEYADSKGDPRLRRSIAKFYSKRIDRQLDWENEVITTVGATEAITSTIRALSKPGDEWILIQPFFNIFKSAIKLAYAVPRYANLRPREFLNDMTSMDWKLDRAEMKNLINSKTRGIVFNNPNNPLGKCYTREELEFIAQLAKDHDLIVVSDEVHEFTTDTMIKMVSLPGMFERTITIGSASKAFCVPGWRVGWVFGPKKFIDKIEKIHGNTVNFIPPAQQRAVATIFQDEVKYFGTPKSFLSRNLAGVKRKRDFVVEALRKAHMLPIAPSGGYCMLAGWWERTNWESGSSDEGYPYENLVAYVARKTSITVFPAEKYYGSRQGYGGINAVRFCYHKSNETLKKAAKKLLLLDSVSNKMTEDDLLLVL